MIETGDFVMVNNKPGDGVKLTVGEKVAPALLLVCITRDGDPSGPRVGAGEAAGVPWQAAKTKRAKRIAPNSRKVLEFVPILRLYVPFNLFLMGKSVNLTILCLQITQIRLRINPRPCHFLHQYLGLIFGTVAMDVLTQPI